VGAFLDLYFSIFVKHLKYYMRNILKSIFISVFPAFALYFFIQSILEQLNSDFSYFLLGEMISSITIIIFFAGLFIKPRARTSTLLKGFGLLIILGFIISLVDILFNETNHIKNLVFSSLLILNWITYIKWYSVFNKRNKTIIKVGVKLPVFQLENLEKESVLSENFLGYYTIYIFYRGNWCPLCMAQIKEVIAEYKELEKRNVSMVLISPQPHSFTKSLADKHKVPFHFLTDVNGTAAKTLGIYQNTGIPAGFQVLGYDSDTVLPTVIITNPDGTIIFADLTDNYRVRPEPKVFLNIIDQEIAKS
jgi:peroxiredoxin